MITGGLTSPQRKWAMSFQLSSGKTQLTAHDATVHIRATGISTIIVVLGAAIVFVSLFWFDLIYFTIGSPASREFILAAGLTSCIAGAAINFANGTRYRFGAGYSGIFLFSSVLLMIQIGRGYVFKDLTLVVAPVIACILVLLDKKYIHQLMSFTMLACVIMMAIEQFTQSFFYVYTSSEVGTFDEKSFLGGAGNFRAKGIFAGITPASAFLLMNFTVNPTLLNWLGVLIGGSLGFARTAQVFAGIALVGLILGREDIRKRILQLAPFVIAGGTIVAVLGFSLSNDITNVIDRLIQVLDFNESTNISRVYFWNLGISIFASYSDFVEVIFGVPNITANYGIIGLESSILSVIVEQGLYGFLLYAFGIFLIARKFMKEHLSLIFCFLAFFVAFATVSFAKSLGLGVLVWIAALQDQVTTEKSGL